MTTVVARPSSSPPAMGHNQPPLEDQVLMDFNDALRDREGLLARIDAMAAKADEAGPCENDDTAGAYGDFIKMANTAAKAVEEEREKLNRPILTAQRALKAAADAHSKRATDAAAKVRAKLDPYLAKKEAERRAEEARLAEIERQKEVERQRVIAEARAQAEREAEAERQRLQAIEDARAEREGREAAAVEVVAEPVYTPEPEPAFNPLGVSKAPLRGHYGTAVSVVETWNVTVENIRQVPDTYLKHPTVIEALEKVIRPHVRGKNGIREIKGCRIFATLGSSVR